MAEEERSSEQWRWLLFLLKFYSYCDAKGYIYFTVPFSPLDPPPHRNPLSTAPHCSSDLQELLEGWDI